VSAIAELPRRLAMAHRTTPVLALGLIVGAGALVHALLALRSPSPWIVPDELIYSELAKSIAAGHLPAVRGVTTFGYGLVYPIVVAPAWLLTRITSAYAAAKVINAVLISLVAVPAYALARHFVGRRLAVVVAALSVLAPASMYAGTILVENALYPLFVLALLTMARALERPTVGRQLAVVAAVAVAYETKPSALALAPAYLCAIWLHALLRRRRGGLRPYRFSFAVLGGGAAVAVAASAAAGQPGRILGAYAVVVHHLDPVQIPWWFLFHLADLDLYVAIVPFAATLLVTCMAVTRRVVDARAAMFVAIAVPVIAWTVALSAAFASWPSAGAAGLPATTARVYERSTFEVVVLLLLGLAIWIEAGLPRPRRLTAIAIVVAAALPALVPVSKLSFNANFQAMAVVPALAVGATGLAWVAVAVVAGALAAIVFLGSTAANARSAWVLVGAWFVVVSLFVFASVSDSARQTRSAAFGGSPTWIDDAVGSSGSPVAVLWREPGSGIAAPSMRQRVVWIDEFFNRRVGAVYELGGEMSYGLPATRVTVRDGVVDGADGRPVRSPLVLALCSTGIVGRVVADDPATGAAVFRTDGVVRIDGGRSVGCSTSGRTPSSVRPPTRRR